MAQQPWYKYSTYDSLWQYVGNAGLSQTGAGCTSLAFSPIGEPYLAFEDWANSGKATVMKFNGNNWVNVGTTGFSVGQSVYIKLAFNPIDSLPYVAYQDARLDSYDATVMRFDGNSWVNVGNESFSSTGVDNLSFAFSLSGQPYVAIQSVSCIDGITVMKFDGTNWVFVGDPCFSGDQDLYPSLAFSPSDTLPYVAFSSLDSSGKTTVMKFNGNSWVFVGSSSGFSDGQTNDESLAFNPIDGFPYVGYGDGINGGKATVKRFDGSNWVNVGIEGFSAKAISYTSLAFSHDGQPFVAYVETNNYFPYKATVMRFDGNNWVNVGNPEFSEDSVCFTSLAFSQLGEPYVAFGGDIYSYTMKASVMKYDSVFVGINELQQSKFSIYPNPASVKITIETYGETQGGNLAIVNIEGQQLITYQITQPKTQLDISSLPRGVYFVRVTNDKTSDIRKLVKK